MALGHSVKTLLKSAAGTLTLQVTSATLGLASTFLLARILGAREYGIYAFVLSVVHFASMTGVRGYDRLLVREIAAAKSSWGRSALVEFAQGQVVVAAVAGSLLALFVGVIIWLTGSYDWLLPGLWVASPLIVFLALSTLWQSALIGYRKVIQGQVGEFLIRPAIFLSLIVFVLAKNAEATTALVLYGSGSFCALIVTSRFVRGNVRKGMSSDELTSERAAALQQSAKRFLGFGLLAVCSAHADRIVIGLIAGPEANGVFAVILAAATLVAFPLTALNASLGPVAASLIRQRSFVDLQRLVTTSTRLVFVVSLVPAIGLLLFGEAILAVAGSSFVFGYDGLLLLVAGQLFNVFAGSVGLLLMMSGYEADATWAYAASLVLRLLLQVVLIPKMGITGAAAANALSVIVWNGLLIFIVRRRLGISPTAIGRNELS